MANGRQNCGDGLIVIREFLVETGFKLVKPPGKLLV